MSSFYDLNIPLFAFRGLWSVPLVTNVVCKKSVFSLLIYLKQLCGLLQFNFILYNCIQFKYLIRGDVINNPKTKPTYSHIKSSNADTAFSAKMRENNVDLFVTNRLDWGHLISADKFNTSHLHNELYNMKQNRLQWEKLYLHPNYSQSLDLNFTIPSVRKRNKFYFFTLYQIDLFFTAVHRCVFISHCVNKIL